MPRPPRQPRRTFIIVIGGCCGILILVAFALWWFQRDSASNLVEQAKRAYDRGDFDKANSLARQRLKQDNGDRHARRIAARVAARRGQDKTALALMSDLETANLDAHDFMLIGRSLARVGNADRAIEAYETAMKTRPADPEILDPLAELCIQNDRHYAAQQLAAQLAEIPSHEPRGNLLLAVARDQLNDPAGAAAALRRCLELDPNLESGQHNPAEPFRLLFIRSLLRSGQPAEARDFIQSRPGSSIDAEQTWLLSRALMQEGKWDQAASTLRGDPSYRTNHALEPEPAPYVGAARCAECHQATASRVLASRHATTFAYVRDLETLELPPKDLDDPGSPQVRHSLARRNGQLEFETDLGDQVFRAVAEYAFGSLDHFTSFVGPDDHGSMRMLRMSHFHSPQGIGWDLTTNLPLQPPHPDQFLGKPLDGNDGLRRCLTCHTTNFRAALDRKGPESADHSIGCEGCHGPGGHHVAAVNAAFIDPAIAATHDASAQEINTLCARCHTMHKSQAVTAPRTDPLWTRFPSLTLTWSRCFNESDAKLSCLTCHDPHQNADTAVPRNEARCLQCHSPSGIKSRAASDLPKSKSTSVEAPDAARSPTTILGTFAPCPVNPANGCLTCHMPRSWDQKTHSFKTDHYIRIRK
jgi:tetratricopeptide (TPR) repeat protein